MSDFDQFSKSATTVGGGDGGGIRDESFDPAPPQQQQEQGEHVIIGGGADSSSKNNRDSLNLDDFEKVEADQLSTNASQTSSENDKDTPAATTTTTTTTATTATADADLLADMSSLIHPAGASVISGETAESDLKAKEQTEEGTKPFSAVQADVTDPLLFDPYDSSSTPVSLDNKLLDFDSGVSASATRDPMDVLNFPAQEEKIMDIEIPQGRFESQVISEATNESLFDQDLLNMGSGMPQQMQDNPPPVAPANNRINITSVEDMMNDAFPSAGVQDIAPEEVMHVERNSSPPPLRDSTPPRQPTPPPRQPTPPPRQPTPPPREPTPPPRQPTPPPRQPTPPPRQPTPPPRQPTPPPRQPTPPPRQPTPPPREPTPPPRQPTPPPQEPTPPPRQPTPPPQLVQQQSSVLPLLRETTPPLLQSALFMSKKGVEPVLSFQESTVTTSSTSYRISESTKATFAVFNPLVDLIYWRDVKKTGVVFGGVMVILLSLAYLSLISVVSYTSLAILSATITFRVYKNIMQAVQKSQDGHPFKNILEKDTNLPSDKVYEATDVIVKQINSTITELKRLFLVEDLVDSVKFGCLLWCLTYVGSWFNGLTLVILTVVALFSLPKVYEQNQAQIDQYVGLVRTQVNDVMSKVKAALPIGNKEKAQ